MSTPVPPHDEPLAVEDFRSLRRWLAVLSVVAVVATGFAVWALVQARDSDDEKASRERVALLERQLRSRIGQLDEQQSRGAEESDVRRLERRGAEESDVAGIDKRLRRVEDDMTDVADNSADIGRAVNRLDRRVSTLARQIRALRETAGG